ncbi:peroxidase, family 2 domain-containing protein [Hirsutella rhossiliensis]|uniref:Peroxidase, family 2 domain-containing protein n=1 Tax=Hirsutella rhossiliensis TaxID=111463 RepID=A0A9P8MNK5_9HYPO|nr:peroxidase, family 2 domain-containing protein [Hirsutella rhossiliensis]KAH0958252.1 peroxidase, family 2 domain-containing protein [Hirsutella rhossiliensis]
MKLQPGWASTLCLLTSSAAAAITQPKLDLKDPRFQSWSRPGAGDVRCACPALNSLANHGFLPHSGKRINSTNIIIAAFNAFGLSPDTAAVIITDDLQNAGASFDLVFDLDDVQRDSWNHEHDCSLSRRDAAEDPSFAFNQGSWNDTLNALKTCDKIDVNCFAKAKVARINAQRKKRPATKYNPIAAAHGATEIGLLLGVFKSSAENMRLAHIRSLFESERIPVNLGWVPVEFAAGVEDVLDIGTQVLKADPAVLQNAGGVKDIVNALAPPTNVPQDQVKALIRAAGFPDPDHLGPPGGGTTTTTIVAPKPPDKPKIPSKPADPKDVKHSDDDGDDNGDDDGDDDGGDNGDDNGDDDGDDDGDDNGDDDDDDGDDDGDDNGDDDDDDNDNGDDDDGDN